MLFFYFHGFRTYFRAYMEPGELENSIWLYAGSNLLYDNKNGYILESNILCEFKKYIQKKLTPSIE